ncbi:MAG: glycerate kinase [Clostridiales bacterium]|nr:glycerate kinase [Clostridiales bacterium]
MKIVIAPDSFKGSLTAAQVCAAVASGIRRARSDAEIVCVPMADGGEGTVRSLIDGLGGEIVSCAAEDPLGRTIAANYGLTEGGTAVIEIAQASGLTLLAESERNPLVTSTYGAGQLILDALDRGAREFIIGIGGSATNDGGAGMAQALGCRLLDKRGKELPRGGGALEKLVRIDASEMDGRIRISRFTVACDVDNPLLGERGASKVFGPQKGATPEMTGRLDRGLAVLAGRLYGDLGKDIAEIPGAGAAGGLGAGCIAFLGANLIRGAELVIAAMGLAARLEGASFIITGEGRTDSQTMGGKTVYGVVNLAKKLGVPAVIISGSLADGAEKLLDCGAVRMYALMQNGVTLESAMQNGAALLEERSEYAVCEFIRGRGN